MIQALAVLLALVAGWSCTAGAPAGGEATGPAAAADGSASGGALQQVGQALGGGGATTAPATGGEPAESPPADAAVRRPALPDFEGSVASARDWRRYGRSLLDALIGFVPSLLRALIVLLVFWGLYRVATGVFRGVVRRTNADPSVLGIGTRLIKYVLLAFGLIMAASQLGFAVGSVLAGISIVGLAVGLAAQESLSNLFAGLIILWDRPFRVGDNVEIAGTFGQVKEIRLRTTRILTLERLDAILPNKAIINQEIINHTLNPQLRLGVQVGIAYKEDTREARRVLLAAVEGHRLILDEPAPTVVVRELADSAVVVELRVWLRDPHAEREAQWEITELAKIALDEAGIQIPFPQRTLHFGSGTFPIRRVAAEPAEEPDEPQERQSEEPRSEESR